MTAAIGTVETVATVIADAVGEQAAATREITNSVQAVSATTSAAAEALRVVLTIAENTDLSSQEALAASGRVGETAESLRAEVTDFLSAISGGNEANRRLYERIPVHGATAGITIEGQPPVRVTIRDISRGGLAVLHSVTATPGTHVDVDLPGGGTVKARVVRASGGKRGAGVAAG